VAARFLVDYLEGAWDQPDNSLWEVRGPRRHFVHSKVMAWAGLDRAVHTVEHHGLPGPHDRWRALRDEIHAEICRKGYDPERNTFTQFYGSKGLDAALLLLPPVGFLPWDDPRVLGTIDAVRAELCHDHLVLRYDTQTDGRVDGLPGTEGAFLACSFWLADALDGTGRHAPCSRSAVLIMLGHVSLALLPGFAGLTVGLCCVAIGSGGLKANATSLVGALYRPGDERRDAGFSLFYLGAFVGPLLTGLAQQRLGFHYGFGLAAIGMAAGLAQYAFGRRNLSPDANTVPNPLPAARRPVVIAAAVGAVALVVALIATGVITPANLSTVTVAVAAVAYFAVILTSGRVDATERSRVTSFIPMFLASFVFFALYQQQFTVVILYADQRLDRTLFGWEMPVPWMNSVNPVFIILLAGVFAALWTKLGPRQPSSPVKFALGTTIMGLAFLTFLPWSGDTGNTTPLVALVGILLRFTIAELLLSPVGLSLATKLAPQGVPHPDGRPQLPVHRARHHPGRHPRQVLRPHRRDALLPRRRRRRGDLRHAARRREPADPQADARVFGRQILPCTRITNPSSGWADISRGDG
jgi:amino acid/peptide:H+ symporter